MMELQVDRDGPFPVARLSGALAAQDAPDLTDSLHEFVSGPGAKLAIDLSALESMDSSGLSALIGLVTRARLGGGQVMLIAPTSFVTGVFNVTRLDTWFDICPDLEVAARRLR